MTTSKCKSCGAPIVWAVTEDRKNMPLDAGLISGFVLDPEETGSPKCKAVQVRTSHFANCPDASSWRKPKEQG